jgi:glycosyltransferase involved in cell wall biosynthesis
MTKKGRPWKAWKPIGAAVVVLVALGIFAARMEWAASLKDVLDKNVPYGPFLGLMAVLPVFGFPISAFLVLGGIRFGIGRGILAMVITMPFHLLAVYFLTLWLRPRVESFLKCFHYDKMDYVKDQHKLAELYSAADLFVNPGTRETFGLVSVEAQSCGTRVLGIRGGGMDETLEGEQPLIMAKSPTVGDLADAIVKALDLRETPEAGLQRRRRIEEKFSLHRTFERLISLYTDLKHGGPIDPWFSE